MVVEILEYRTFESLQNKYKFQDNTTFFPPSLNTDKCFSRHLLVNRFLNTKNPKFLFWSIEKDSNVLMDSFCMETINYWRGLLIESNSREDKEILAQLLVNIGIALGEYKNSSKFFHYESGFVHCSKENQKAFVSFEVHPPRRCFRLVENFERIVRKIKQVEILGADMKSELTNKYSIDDLNIDFSDHIHIAAQVISKVHNKIPKNRHDTFDLFLTPFLAEEIYKDAKIFCEGLSYIVDTFQTVDYWSPDKKR